MGGPEPFVFESPVLERESFRLLQIIHASSSLHAECIRRRIDADAKRKAGGLQDAAKLKLYTGAGSLTHLLRGEEPEANRIVLNIAVVVRNSLDHSPLLLGEDAACSMIWTARDKFEGPLPKPFPETPMAIWREFEKHGVKAEALGIRETCNKIIHAKGAEWSRSTIEGSEIMAEFNVGRALDGFLFLFGDRQVSAKKSEVWICMVNVEEFCLQTLNYV
jgi:hypothetical protein